MKLIQVKTQETKKTKKTVKEDEKVLCECGHYDYKYNIQNTHKKGKICLKCFTEIL